MKRLLFNYAKRISAPQIAESKRLDLAMIFQPVHRVRYPCQRVASFNYKTRPRPIAYYGIYYRHETIMALTIESNLRPLKAAFLSSLISLANIWPALAGGSPLLNEPVDVSSDFHDFANFYYLADHLANFDPATHSGSVVYQRSQLVPAHSFNHDIASLASAKPNEFPANQYAADPALPFSIEFVSPKTIRIRMTSGPQVHKPQEELMLAGEVPRDDSWQYSKVAGGYRYASAAGSVTIMENPWHIELRDASGKLLTATDHGVDNKTSFTPIMPFAFVRRTEDYSRSFNAAFTLSPGEAIFGCGESFTSLNKRGQKIVLWTDDACGVESRLMYKPVPFFISNRGYGMFIHTSTPITLDIGSSFSGVNSMMIGDDELDLFVFLGTPKDILDEYTKLTGKSPLPPLWSFGLWMSRCTYNSENQVTEIAGKLRQNNIPCDVLHLDTGWFETDWQCDYEFSPTRFPTPKKMLADLKHDGFRISCWQLPYFVPKNKLFPELLAQNLVVRDGKGNLPEEDAILDFSNPKTVDWYQGKLAGLLEMGVSAIKVDFGEAAPVNGIYADGRSGFYEHNLYPLRYNKAVADITKKTTGDNIIWARSAWAGSQRYPLHWGGDAESTDSGMAAELRGGLSFGLSGFSFWSHDVGGFTANSVSEMSPDLFARWLAFGMLTSHSRCHGDAPKEPWLYGDAFMNRFRKIDELKYRLMPYVYAQAKDCSDHGLPMVRALFVEFPADPGSWQVDDEYMYGSDLLVAPLMHEKETGRAVYLPPGTWIDYQSGKSYTGGWQSIETGEIPAVILVRNGTAIPRIALAQSTSQMDWSRIELAVFAQDASTAHAKIFLPGSDSLSELTLNQQAGKFMLAADPFAGKVTWQITEPTH
jgi:alpha-D-xyloside xylohydrolase